MKIKVLIVTLLCIGLMLCFISCSDKDTGASVESSKPTESSAPSQDGGGESAPNGGNAESKPSDSTDESVPGDSTDESKPSDSTDESVPSDSTDESKPSEDKDKKEYHTVTFVTNNDTTIGPVLVEHGEKAKQPQPLEKAGYTFDGWCLGDEKWSFVDCIVTEDITLYAVWEIDVYTITYEKNGGTGDLQETFTINDLPLSLKELKNKTNYLFNYWYKESDFSGEPVFEITEICNVTLYAEYIECTDGLALEENNGSYTVTGYTGLATDIVIPMSYKSKKITRIGFSVFENCTSLTSITIPFVGESLNGTSNTHFSYIFGAPSYRYSYNSSYIPKSLKEVIITGGNSIGEKAFYECDSLTSIEIPNSVTSIGEQAFYRCTKLTSVTIPNSVTSIGNYAFYGCTSLTSVTIPESVTSIGALAFCNCTSLTSIEIPNSVTSIGNRAFYGCTSLSYTQHNSAYYLGNEENPYMVLVEVVDKDIKNFEITEKTKMICFGAFTGCASLTSVTVPNSIVSINESAFYDCTSLKEVHITDIGAWCGIRFDNYYANPLYYAKNLYLNGERVTELVIPENVTSIGEHAFIGCTSLTSIEIPNSVTSIGYSAFGGCTSLTNITIPESVTSIGDYAFSWCGFTSIEIPNGVTSIGDFAFYYCTKLTSVDMTNGVTSIGIRAFEGCTGLTSVTISDSIISIGSGAFSGCSNLSYFQHNNAYFLGNEENPYVLLMKVDDKTITNFEINEKTRIIYDSVFRDCTSLKSIEIPNSVTSIGAFAFCNCTSLTSIEIPNSVTSIGDYAFEGCTSLTSVTIPNSITNIGVRMFYQCTSLTSITIPNSVTSIGTQAFYNCKSLKSIIIPNSVISMDHQAFYCCHSLTFYCEAMSKPSGWDGSWNLSNRPVEWGYKQGN